MKFIIPTLLIAAAAGVFFGYINPIYVGTKEITTEIARFDEALDKAAELTAVRDRLLSRFNAFSTKDRERLEKFLPSTIDNVRLIIDIDAIASKYNLDIKNVSLSGSDAQEASRGTIGPADSDLHTVELSFSVEASYEDIQNLVHDLGQSLRLVDVVNISFSSQDDDESSYAVTLRTYWLP